MKVTKLRSGYRVTCSDSEFEALAHMVAHGSGALEREHHKSLSGTAKAAIRREPFTSEGGPLTVTEDRRDAASDREWVPGPAVGREAI